jgi:hypothetical protein
LHHEFQLHVPTSAWQLASTFMFSTRISTACCRSKSRSRSRLSVSVTGTERARVGNGR